MSCIDVVVWHEVEAFHRSRMPMITWVSIVTGADPGFQARGGALKKNCAEWREARKFLGYFVWKITILRQKILFFPIAEGGANILAKNFRASLHSAQFFLSAPPLAWNPGSAPDDHCWFVQNWCNFYNSLPFIAYS
jgi:hypothetical protein